MAEKRFRRRQRLAVRTVRGSCLHVAVAESFRSRLLGLAFCDDFGLDGLLIPRCSGIHTFGMRFDLDVAFIDNRSGLVLQVAEGVGRRRMLSPTRGHGAPRTDLAVLELRAGEARPAGVSAGELLRSGPGGPWEPGRPGG